MPKLVESGKRPAWLESLVGSPASLADLVRYQEGSLASRTLIAGRPATLTLYAFSEGQGMSEHTSAFDVGVHILEGEAEITVSGKGFRMKQGQMVILPANQPHALTAAKNFKMLLIIIRD